VSVVAPACKLGIEQPTWVDSPAGGALASILLFTLLERPVHSRLGLLAMRCRLARIQVC
jgi:hypothetical protein